MGVAPRWKISSIFAARSQAHGTPGMPGSYGSVSAMPTFCHNEKTLTSLQSVKDGSSIFHFLVERLRLGAVGRQRYAHGGARVTGGSRSAQAKADEVAVRPVRVRMRFVAQTGIDGQIWRDPRVVIDEQPQVVSRMCIWPGPAAKVFRRGWLSRKSAYSSPLAPPS